jgi:hypothetical protein
MFPQFVRRESVKVVKYGGITVRLPDISEPEKKYDLCLPLWYRLDEDSQYALSLAYRRATDYHKRLVPPGGKPDLMPFDAEKEIKKAPGSENHMRETR